MMSATKFICRFCNKRYPCGKSLGGHLRSHRIIGDDLSESGLIEVGESSGYGLRTNPKKTKRFGGDLGSVAFHQQCYSNVCKECGKGFQSMKALCGHMACHSDKASDWPNEEEEDSEENDVKQFKPISESDQSNGYSSISEIEQEQEELAKCLMMLSRDSSDSFVTESKSSAVCVRVKRKLKSGEILDDEIGNLELDSSIDEQLKTKDGSPCPGGFSFGVTSSISSQKHRCDICFKEFDSRKALSGHKSASSCRKKFRTLWGGKNSSNDLKSKKVGTSSSRKSYRHECPICFRVFKSGQALGGHKRSHFLGIGSQRSMPLATNPSEINHNKAPSLIDLNLPAPVEEDVNDEVGFVLF